MCLLFLQFREIQSSKEMKKPIFLLGDCRFEGEHTSHSGMAGAGSQPCTDCSRSPRMLLILERYLTISLYIYYIYRERFLSDTPYRKTGPTSFLQVWAGGSCPEKARQRETIGGLWQWEENSGMQSRIPSPSGRDSADLVSMGSCLALFWVSTD